jgi:hypothetical protein
VGVGLGMLALKVLVLIFLISFIIIKISTTHKFPCLLLIALSPWGPIFGPPSIYLSLWYLQASYCCFICSTSPYNSSDSFSIYLFAYLSSRALAPVTTVCPARVKLVAPSLPLTIRVQWAKSRIVDSHTVIQCLYRLHLDG